MSFELLVPVLQKLQGDLGIDGRAAISLFLIAAVHCALMVMSFKVGSTLIGGWRVFGGRAERAGDSGPAPAWGPMTAQPMLLPPPSTLRTIPAAAFMTEPAAMAHGAAALPGGTLTRVIETRDHGHAPAAPGAHARARGIGSRFRPMPKAQELLK